MFAFSQECCFLCLGPYGWRLHLVQLKDLPFSMKLRNLSSIVILRHLIFCWIRLVYFTFSFKENKINWTHIDNLRMFSTMRLVKFDGLDGNAIIWSHKKMHEEQNYQGLASHGWRTISSMRTMSDSTLFYTQLLLKFAMIMS